jgi:hypothetical protein
MPVEYLVGVGLALAVSLMATFAGFDKERTFYPVVTMVVASYYALFAVMGGSVAALMTESAVMALFIAAAVVGFRRNLWLVACALVAHGIFDFVHGRLIPNPGVPSWWPMFCLSYDVVAGLYLAALLWRSRVAALAR